MHDAIIGPSQFLKITQQLSSLADLFNSPEAPKEIDWPAVDADLAWESQPNNHIITYDMPNYPAKLREINQAPLLLFASQVISFLYFELYLI